MQRPLQDGEQMLVEYDGFDSSALPAMRLAMSAGGKSSKCSTKLSCRESPPEDQGAGPTSVRAADGQPPGGPVGQPAWSERPAPSPAGSPGAAMVVTVRTWSAADWVPLLNSVMARPTECPSSGRRLGPKITSASSSTKPISK